MSDDTYRRQGFFDEVIPKAMRSETPQPAYARFAAECPVARNPDDTVTVTRYKDIQFIAGHRQVLGNGHAGPGVVGARARLIPLDLDGEEHRRWRKLLDPLFAPRQVKPLEPKIRARARDLLDTFADRGEADVFREWCEPLPSSIFLSILGLSQDDRPDLIDFMSAQLHPDPGKSPEDNRLRQKLAAERCYSYLNDLIRTRRGHDDPGDDFVGWLLAIQDDDGGKLSDEEVQAVMYIFLLAGLDTVTSTLATILAFLARHPDHRQRLLDRPELWPSAIEELLRFDPVIPLANRKTLADLQLPSGEFIAAETVINLSWPSANLDPEIFANPLEVDFTRSPNPHLTFASGWHRCLGSHLARLEIRAALEEFHARIPRYEIKPGVDLVYSHDARAPRPLPLIWK